MATKSKTKAKPAAKPAAKASKPVKAVAAPKKAVAPAPVPVRQQPIIQKPMGPIKATVAAEIRARVIEFKPKAADLNFEKGDYVVYPTHGVGRVTDVESKTIAGHKLDLFVISFEQERMTLRVPVAKVEASGLRKLSSRKIMDSALTTLKGRSRISRAMWNRRAQEYEAKINSGDPVSIAEVVRDLHRNAGQPDQSYSERQIYESALDRLSRELAAVERIDKDAATAKLHTVLKKVA